MLVLQTKFKVPSLAISEYILEQNLKKNGSWDPGHAPFMGGLSSLS